MQDDSDGGNWDLQVQWRKLLKRIIVELLDSVEGLFVVHGPDYSFFLKLRDLTRRLSG